MTLPSHLSGTSATGLHEGEPIAQFEIGSLKNFVYLVIDWKSREAWLVDIQRDFKPWQNALQQNGLTLRGILLTHTHHDHVAGLETLLTENSGIPVYFGSADRYRIVDQLPPGANARELRDGEKLQLGSLHVEAFHTPGHSPGEFCYFVASANGKPPYLFTGDTVFIEDCGRTDFEGGSDEQLFASLQKIKKLPSETVILPGHHYRPTTASTLEREKQKSPPMLCQSVAELKALP